jgi:murein DD-endopeptidase MepM/ murein hydrolase activator NlpD
VVALGAGAAFDDAKTDASQLASFSGELDEALAERAEVAERADRAERESNGLASSISEAPDIWMLPLTDYTLSSPYGPRWNTFHGGVDLAVPTGTPIHAMHSGTVVLSRWNGGYGYAVEIDHGDGILTLYGHNSQLLVSEGDTVEAGDVIALAGNTGHSFGSHSHVEVHINGETTDPVPWLKDHGVDLVEGTDALYTG